MTVVFTTVFLHLNYCSFVHETAIFEGYAKLFFAPRESCVLSLQSYANRQPRLRYKTDLSWDFALMLT